MSNLISVLTKLDESIKDIEEIFLLSNTIYSSLSSSESSTLMRKIKKIAKDVVNTNGKIIDSSNSDFYPIYKFYDDSRENKDSKLNRIYNDILNETFRSKIHNQIFSPKSELNLSKDDNSPFNEDLELIFEKICFIKQLICWPHILLEILDDFDVNNEKYHENYRKFVIDVQNNAKIIVEKYNKPSSFSFSHKKDIVNIEDLKLDFIIENFNELITKIRLESQKTANKIISCKTALEIDPDPMT